MQPNQTGQDINIKLIWNAMRWLLRDRLADFSADQRRQRLLFREQDVRQWEKEEQGDFVEN